MNNPYHNQYLYCKEEKERAMALSQSAADQKTKYNTHQAINAWDELLGQLYKPKPISQKQFEKAKQTALSIAGLMAAGEYKTETLNKIKALEL